MSATPRIHETSNSTVENVSARGLASDTHDTVPTQFVEANDIRFAYRRFGKPSAVPIVMNIQAPT